jgi:hypothetical protein
MAVLGVMRGFSQLPPDMQNGVKAVGDSLFINTTYSFNTAVEATYEYAMKNIREHWGSVQNETLYIPVQQATAPKLEVSIPDVIYYKSADVFSKIGFETAGLWQVYKEKLWDGESEHDQAVFSGNAGDELTFTFDGTGLALFGNWVKDGSKADIYLEGKFNHTIDTYYHYANQEHLNVCIWHAFQLSPGTHSVKLVVKGEKNSLSTGTNVYVCQAVIYKTAKKKCDTYEYSFEK